MENNCVLNIPLETEPKLDKILFWDNCVDWMSADSTISFQL